MCGARVDRLVIAHGAPPTSKHSAAASISAGIRDIISEKITDFVYWSKELVRSRPVISITHVAIAAAVMNVLLTRVQVGDDVAGRELSASESDV